MRPQGCMDIPTPGWVSERWILEPHCLALAEARRQLGSCQPCPSQGQGDEAAAPHPQALFTTFIGMRHNP